jgi:hypothetical protein
MRLLSGILLAVCLAYGYVELRRRREMRDFLTRSQRIRRAVNYAALCIVIMMAFGGTWLPSGHRTREVAVFELGYWSLCLVIAAIVPIIAVWDYRAIIRQVQTSKLAAERDESLREAVEAVAQAERKNRRRAEFPRRNGAD